MRAFVQLRHLVIDHAELKHEIDKSREQTEEKFRIVFTVLDKLASDDCKSHYAIECIQGTWSVRELKRQIGSLYYERSGLSRNKKKLSDMLSQCAQTADPTMTRLAQMEPLNQAEAFFIPGRHTYSIEKQVTVAVLLPLASLTRIVNFNAQHE